MIASLWIVSALVLLVGGSFATRRSGNNLRAWRLATGISGTVAVGLGLARYLGEVGTLEVAYTCVAFLMVAALPRLENFRSEAAKLLALQAAGLGVLGFSESWLVFPALASPLWILRRRPRIFLCYEALGVSVFVGGIVLVYLRESVGAGLCFAVSAMIRQGVFPFHSGLFSLCREESEGCLEAALLAPTGIILFWKFALPLLPLQAGWNVALVANLTFSAVYLALLCLAQENIERIAGLAPTVVASLLFAVEAAGAPRFTPSWILFTVGGAGLALTARLARARDAASAVPALAGFYLVFSFALGGLPGTLGFVAEEQLEHALLNISPTHLVAALAAIALMTIALYRAYTKLFLGKPLPPEVAALTRREQLSLAALAIALVGLGFLEGF